MQKMTVLFLFLIIVPVEWILVANFQGKRTLAMVGNKQFATELLTGVMENLAQQSKWHKICFGAYPKMEEIMPPHNCYRKGSIIYFVLFSDTKQCEIPFKCSDEDAISHKIVCAGLDSTFDTDDDIWCVLIGDDYEIESSTGILHSCVVDY